MRVWRSRVLDLGGPGSLARVEDVLIGELARQFGLWCRKPPSRNSPFRRGRARVAQSMTDVKTIPLAVINAQVTPMRRSRNLSRREFRSRNRAALPERRSCRAKPSWIRVRIPERGGEAQGQAAREPPIVTVCEGGFLPEHPRN